MLTAARLRELLHYDPDTGVFTWRVARPGRTRAGATAGSVTNYGYVSIKIEGRKYLASRLAWLYMTGEWPSDEIDHEDGVRTNDRWSNLRSATHSENGCNKPARGFYRRANGRFSAQIKKNGKRIPLGTYDTEVEAHAAYARAAVQLHGEFTRVA